MHPNWRWTYWSCRDIPTKGTFSHQQSTVIALYMFPALKARKGLCTDIASCPAMTSGSSFMKEYIGTFGDSTKNQGCPGIACMRACFHIHEIIIGVINLSYVQPSISLFKTQLAWRAVSCFWGARPCIQIRSVRISREASSSPFWLPLLHSPQISSVWMLRWRFFSSCTGITSLTSVCGEWLSR